MLRRCLHVARSTRRGAAWLLLAGCGASWEPTTIPEVDDPVAPVGPVEDIPSPAPRTHSAPALAALVCDGPIPVDGKVDCSLELRWAEGDLAWEGRAGVGVHGRSSAGFPKKQYAVELRDEAGADAPADLFGMGEEADWLLNGMYLDRALFRNKLAYDLFREMGGYAPECVWVELTLDGAYLGVYLLGERIDHDRVGQPDDDGTGRQFLVRADESGLTSSVQYAHWSVEYPDPAPDGVAVTLAELERRILADDPTLWDLLSSESFVDFVILEEALKNNDAYYLSHHLYTAADGLLHAAPWDLDLTLGQPSYNNNELAEGFVLYRPDLVARPATQVVFQERFSQRWVALRAGLLADEAVVERLHGYRAFLGDAVERNWQVWDLQQVPNVGFPLYAVASPEEEYAHVEAWLLSHLAWMDAHVDAYAAGP